MTFKRISLIGLMILMGMSISSTASQYFYEPFTNYAGTIQRWRPDFSYGQSGCFLPPVVGQYTPFVARDAKFAVINNQACFTGACQSHWEWGNNDWYGTYWIGNAIKLTNANGVRSYSASVSQPFGYEVLRTFAWLDAHNDGAAMPGVYTENQGCAVGSIIWLISDDNSVSGSVEYQSYPNVAAIYDQFRCDVNTNSFLGGFRSQWGSFVNAENRFDLRNAKYSGGTFDLVNDIDHGLEWNYENNWGLNTKNNGVVNSRVSNTNVIGLKITHDGSSIKFYINPNPIDRPGNPYPNEYFQMGAENVSWNDNLRIMLGHESHQYYTEKEDVRYDDLRIRSIADSVTAEIYPAEIKAGEKINFTYFMAPVFSQKDSGIGEIRLIKPANYTSAWSNIRVYTEWGDSANNGTIALLSSTNGTPQSVGKVWVKTNGNEIKIRFCQKSDSINAVVRSNTVNRQIEIKFSLTAPASPSVTGDVFDAYVNCNKYYDTSYSTNSTTADMLAISGNAVTVSLADGAIIPDYDVNSVKGFSEPAASAAITPNRIYQDTKGFNFDYRIATTPTNTGASIIEASINIPDGFVLSNVSSLKVFNPTNLKIGLVNGTNRLQIRYYNENTGIPNQAGIDFIRFKVTATPTNGIYSWSSIVRSRVGGTSSQYTSTNASYISQKVRVIASPPVATAYETTAGNLVYSTTTTNHYEYIIVNTSDKPANKIRRAKIVLPGVFTQVSNISSQIVPVSSISLTNAGGTNAILIRYFATGTNISPLNNFDRISFKAWDSVPPLKTTNISIPAFVDNFNSDGFKPVTEGSIDYQISFVLPDAIANAGIRTNTIRAVYTTNQFTYRLYNNGTTSNEIYLARILIPDIFTNISGVNSVRALSTKVTNSSIILNYSPTKLKPGELDTITFKMKTKVLNATNVVVDAQVCNSTGTNYYRSVGTLGGASKQISLVLPEPSCSAYVEVNSNSSPPIYIDSSTTTNQMVCYVRNTGESGNDIRQVKIAFPKTIATNAFYTNNGSFFCAKSSVLSNFDGNVRFFDPPTGTNKYFIINYAGAGKALVPGQTDVIRFKFLDKIIGETNLNILVISSNVGSSKEADVDIFKTRNILIKIPPADASGGILPGIQFTGTNITNTFVYIVKNKGRGSNKLNNVVITNTSGIAGWSILYATNTWFSNSACVTWTGSRILINYSNALKPLGAQSQDIVTFKMAGTLSKLTNIVFEMRADNIDDIGFVATSVNSNGSKSVKSTVQPTFAFFTNQIFTSATTNTTQFHFNVINGAPGGQKILKIRVKVPTPVFMTNGMRSSNDSWYGSAPTSRSNDYQIIDYTSKPVLAALPIGRDIRVKNCRSTPTNVFWSMDAFYSNDIVWRPMKPSVTNANRVAIVWPSASGTFTVSPNPISKDVFDTHFVVKLSNSSSSGNNILLARITVPSALTNISFVTSSIPGVNTQIFNQQIFIYYYQTGASLVPGNVDIIHFHGYDNISSNWSGVWQVEVANSSNLINLKNASVQSPGNSDLWLRLFNRDTTFYVTPTTNNALSGTNRFVFVLENKSEPGNIIKSADLYLPPFFLTNSIVISNSRSNTLIKSSNKLTFNYTANFNPGESDTIRIHIRDSWIEGETNVFWTMTALYNTSESNIPIRLPGLANHTNLLKFNMPNPSVYAVLTPTAIYATSKTNKVFLQLQNRGLPGNSIYRASIRIPDVFTNGLTAGSALSGKAFSPTYSAGLFTFNYSGLGLVSQSTDMIAMTLVNSLTSAVVPQIGINCQVSNVKCKAAVTGNTNVSIILAPTCFVLPKQVETSSLSNLFTFNIYNEVTGSYPIKQVLINLPVSYFTNLRYSGSEHASNVISTKSNLIVQYSNAGLSLNKQDNIRFWAFDKISFGSNLVIWPSCRVDNSYASAPARLAFGQSLQVRFTNAAPACLYHIEKGTNNVIYVNEDTNYFNVVLTNAGTGGNFIYKAYVTVPPCFTNFVFVSSSHQPSMTNIMKGVSSFTLNYAAPGNSVLSPGERDVIRIKGYDNVSKNTNVVFSAFVDNYDGKGYAPAQKKIGKNNGITFSFPPNAIAAYIDNDDPSIYTFNTNMKLNFDGIPLIFKVENLSFTNRIEYLRIDYKFPQFRTNVMIQSTFAGVGMGMGITNTGSSIIVDYVSMGTAISNNKSDTITINQYYCLSNTSAVTMTCRVRLDGSTNMIDTVVPAGKDKILSIKRPSWGKMAGKVYPDGMITTIRLFKQGSTTIALDRKGQPASFTFDSGKPFLLDNIVPANYRFEIAADGYLTGSYGLTNVFINSNNIRYSNNRVLYETLQDVRLKAVIVKERSQDEQVRIYTAKDGSSARFIAPLGGVAEDFYLEITGVVPQDIRLSSLAGNAEHKTVLPGSGFRLFEFDLEGVDLQDVDEVHLKKECKVQLPVDSAVVAANGWSTTDLAIAYFDHSTMKWVPIGGVYDPSTQSITAKVNYLFRDYAVIAINKSGGAIFNVKVDNNPFTPGGKNTVYQTANIIFMLDAAYDEVTVNIFNLRSENIRSIKVDGSYMQCTAPWDGKDTDGSMVPAGIYIYQIRAGKNKYSGSILVAK